MLARGLARGARVRLAKRSHLFVGTHPTLRAYSDKPKYNSHKFDNLDLGRELKLEADQARADHELIKRNAEQQYFDREQVNIGDMIAQDPRLQALTLGTPEYKDMMNLVHAEIIARQEKDHKRYEFRERMKAIVYGALLLVGIIGGHQAVIRWGELKGEVLSRYKYKLDDEKVPNLGDDAYNQKKLSNVVAQLEKQLPPVVATVKLSEEPGLYVYGQAGEMLPCRIPYFDGMYLADVATRGDYLAVVDAKGRLYQRAHKGAEVSKLLGIPKLSQVTVGDDYLYGLTKKGEVVIINKEDSQAQLAGDKYRNWLMLSRTRPYTTVAAALPIAQMAVQDDGLLLLDTLGQIHTVDIGLKNPVAQEFTLLNKTVVNSAGKKTLKHRHFTSIAAGSAHALAVDSDNTVWGWGDNLYGQCAIDVVDTTKFQPVPRKLFDVADFKRMCRNVTPSDARSENFAVTAVYAAKETSYIKVECHNGSSPIPVLFSFGNGVKGELGTRYIHVCSQPQLVKALVQLEYLEEAHQVVGIDFDVSPGAEHVVVTMDNAGEARDVATFGDNEFGQYGNGKQNKSTRPVQLPLLIEPEEVGNSVKLAKRLANTNNLRLQMHRAWGQTIKATDYSTAIFYRK